MLDPEPPVRARPGDRRQEPDEASHASRSCIDATPRGPAARPLGRARTSAGLPAHHRDADARRSTSCSSSARATRSTARSSSTSSASPNREERIQASRKRAGVAAAAAEVRPRAVRAAAGAAADREARPGTDREGPDHREAAEGRGRGGGGRGVRAVGRAAAGARREGCACSSTRRTPRSATSTRRPSGPRARCCNYGNFNTYVTTQDLTKQEGLIFRHLLRLILLTRGVRATHAAGRRPGRRGRRS